MDSSQSGEGLWGPLIPHQLHEPSVCLPLKKVRREKREGEREEWHMKTGRYWNSARERHGFQQALEARREAWNGSPL